MPGTVKESGGGAPPGRFGSVPGKPGVVPGSPGVVPGKAGAVPGSPGGVIGTCGGRPGVVGVVPGKVGNAPGVPGGTMPEFGGNTPAFGGRTPLLGGTTAAGLSGLKRGVPFGKNPCAPFVTPGVRLNPAEPFVKKMLLFVLVNTLVRPKFVGGGGANSGRSRGVTWAIAPAAASRLKNVNRVFMTFVEH